MSCILHIETSTDVCSVAVSQDGATIFRVEDFEGPSHAQKLGTFVDEALGMLDARAHGEGLAHHIQAAFKEHLLGIVGAVADGDDQRIG